MELKYLTEDNLDRFIQAALKEDIGDGDHTTLSSIPETAINKAQLIFKEKGIAAGIELGKKIFKAVDASLKVEAKVKDGEAVEVGTVCMYVEGKAQSILTAERLVLNCMQRMSGIASYTAEVVKLVKGTGTTILDTRKTNPNSRIIEKWAVAIGGGQNHRFGLFDMILLKDNHIDFAGTVTAAIQGAKAYLKEQDKNLRIEIETRNLEEVKEALKEGVDVIMLDNMSNNMMREAVGIIGDKAQTEASGGITEQTIRGVAECGVDYISVGALTHSYKSVDISLKAMKIIL